MNAYQRESCNLTYLSDYFIASRESIYRWCSRIVVTDFYSIFYVCNSGTKDTLALLESKNISKVWIFFSFRKDYFLILHTNDLFGWTAHSIRMLCNLNRFQFTLLKLWCTKLNDFFIWTCRSCKLRFSGKKKSAVKLTKKNKGTAVSQEFLCQNTVQLGSTFISIPHIILIINLDADLMFSFNPFFSIF